MRFIRPAFGETHVDPNLNPSALLHIHYAASHEIQLYTSVYFFGGIGVLDF